jgi:hypothetical protein
MAHQASAEIPWKIRSDEMDIRASIPGGNSDADADTQIHKIPVSIGEIDTLID